MSLRVKSVDKFKCDKQGSDRGRTRDDTQIQYGTVKAGKQSQKAKLNTKSLNLNMGSNKKIKKRKTRKS